MGLKLDDFIPKVFFKDQNGRLFNINRMIGKKPIVIYFYLKDDTPSYLKQACGDGEFIDLGSEVISIDSNSKKDTANLLQSTIYLLGLISGWETYVFDIQGKIMAVFNSINTAQHMQIALAALKQHNI